MRVDRNAAYNYWVLKLPNARGLHAPNLKASTIIVNAGYLMRNATMSGSTLNLIGDFNTTTTVEVIGGAPSNLSTLNINGKSTKVSSPSYDPCVRHRLTYILRCSSLLRTNTGSP